MVSMGIALKKLALENHLAVLVSEGFGLSHFQAFFTFS